MSKRIIPFSNGTEAMIWMDLNCNSCTTKCHWKRNMDMGFGFGDITVKTAEFIGHNRITDEYVDLLDECQHKDNFIKTKPKKKQIEHPKLF